MFMKVDSFNTSESCTVIDETSSSEFQLTVLSTAKLSAKTKQKK